MKVLYLSYDGLADHIGQAQVLPYLIGCATAGHEITVISFEKSSRMEIHGERIAGQCTAVGIDWRPQPFRSSPPLLAKAIDLRAMRRAAHAAAEAADYDLVHCRSYPAASVGLGLKRKRGLPLLFDMRGFWPDQRRDGGRWRAASPVGRLLYRHWKKVEASLYAASDHIVVLTAAARAVVARSTHYSGAPISVIPCCADFDLFAIDTSQRTAARAELGVAPGEAVIAYLGSLGTVYRLDAVLRLFAAARHERAGLKLLFIGSGPTDGIMKEARRLGIELSADDVRSVVAGREDVPRWLNAADIGLCFCTPTFSSLGVSATKVGEYLACGLPVIGNRQIGDLAEILVEVGGGIALRDLDDASFERAGKHLAELLDADRAKIRERASRFLDLGHAVAAYRSIYEDIGQAVTLGPAGHG